MGLQVSFLRPIRDPLLHFVAKANELGVQTVLDVGANIGQFGQSLRSDGYRGRIVSFEPLSVAHARLSEIAKNDALWDVAPRCALGEATGSLEINISHNLASSSLLKVEERSLAAEPLSGTGSQEAVAVRRLDDVLQPQWGSPLAMKLDTQGYELHVLRGAPEALKNVAVLLIEMSLTPLYEGGPGFGEVYECMTRNGFRCIGLTQGFADLNRHEVLQMDGLFVRV